MGPYDNVDGIIALNGGQGLEVEFMQHIQCIMSFGVMTPQVLVTNEEVIILDHRGATKIEQALRGISIELSEIGPKETL